MGGPHSTILHLMAWIKRLLRSSVRDKIQNAKDDDGWTPLHFAAQCNSAECVQMLLEAGSDASFVDSHGNYPLLRAVFSSRGDGTVIRKLRAAGADPMQKNLNGVSPISLAATFANYPVAQFFADVPLSEGK